VEMSCQLYLPASLSPVKEIVSTSHGAYEILIIIDKFSCYPRQIRESRIIMVFCLNEKNGLSY
jgi:hypothetical protein